MEVLAIAVVRVIQAAKEAAATISIPNMLLDTRDLLVALVVLAVLVPMVALVAKVVTADMVRLAW